ncbi:histidine phosphatase family protein [Candidatus Woesearchaeota archaeon]|nr:histidine phosphatase family protein [Candidatus Woesearchaeota archaeon]
MGGPKTCSIFLFRHGQTYFNRDKRFTGWKESNLTPLGREQANLIAEKLKDKRIDVAYQTHQRRSKDTLKPVLRFHPECREIITDDRIIERSYGALQGKYHRTQKKVEGNKAYRKLVKSGKIKPLPPKEKAALMERLGDEQVMKIRRNYYECPKNGESIQMVEKRVMSFLRDLIRKMKREKVNVAISAHGNSMRPFRRYFEKLTMEQMMKLENPWDEYFEYKVDV